MISWIVGVWLDRKRGSVCVLDFQCSNTTSCLFKRYKVKVHNINDGLVRSRSLAKKNDTTTVDHDEDGRFRSATKTVQKPWHRWTLSAIKSNGGSSRRKPTKTKDGLDTIVNVDQWPANCG